MARSNAHRASGRLGPRLAVIVVVSAGTLLVGSPAGASAPTAQRGAASSPIVALPVVPCLTDFGVTPPLPQPPTPNRLPVLLSAAVARRVSFYSNGFQTLLAPRGWACRGLVAVDGGRRLSAFPPGAGDPLNPSQSSSPGPAVTGLVPSPGTGQVSAIACALFPESNTTGSCPLTKASGESVQRPTDEVALFDDPPHVRGSGAPSGGADPAAGAVIYLPQSPAGATVTCTLAPRDVPLCPVVLNDFLARTYPSLLSAGGQ